MTILRNHPQRILIGVLFGAIIIGMVWVFGQARIESSLAMQRLNEADRHRPVNTTDEIIAEYEAWVRQQPEDVNAYAVLGAAYVQHARESGDPSDYARADTAFDQALRRDAQNVEALIGKGTLALARHQFRDALAIGQQALSVNSTIPRIYGVIGDAQIELGLYDEAVETIQSMVDLRPDLSSYSRVSYARELHGDMQGAIEAMQWAVEAGSPNRENTNWTRVQLGHLYFNSDDWDAAEFQYKQALAAYPNYVHALAGLARLHAARGEYDQAVELYTEAIDRIPLAEYVIALGDVYDAMGQHTEAQQQFELVDAIDQLYRANGVDTDLEMVLYAIDHHATDADTLTRAYRAYENRPTVYAADVLAWALYEDGQYAKAQELSQEALRLDTQDARLMFHAGMIAYQLEQFDQAQTCLEQALALNPSFSLRYQDMAHATLAALRNETTTNSQ